MHVKIQTSDDEYEDAFRTQKKKNQIRHTDLKNRSIDEMRSEKRTTRKKECEDFIAIQIHYMV